MKFIDLFGGIGGFRLGMKKYDNECVWYNDINKYCVDVYNRRFKEENEAKDIRKVDETGIPEHDCICAGFPCQSFSIAGKRKGMEDIRGTLFFEICRIARHHRPKILFLENVRGLLSHDEGETFRVILQSLWDMGYDVEWQVLNSKNYGVPQNRERVFIIGHLGGFGGRQIFPIRETSGAYSRSKERRKEIPPTRQNIQPKKGQTKFTSGNARKYPSPDENMVACFNENYGEAGSKNLIQKSVLGKDSIGQRVYDCDGIATALRAEGGGLGAKTGLYDVFNHNFRAEQEVAGCLKGEGTSESSLSTVLVQSIQLVGDRDNPSISIKDIANTIPANPMSDRQQAVIVARPHGYYKGGEKELPCLRESSFEHNDFLMLPEVANAVDCDGYLRKGERPRDENNKPQLLPIGHRRIRRLTPIECERLQGFEDNWTQWGVNNKISDSQRYKMLGNAVTVNVIEAISERLNSVFEKEK